MSPPGPSFTDKQGQYLAFIDAYTRVYGRAPAEADMQRHFGVTPPSVHQMVLTLERAGLIRRQPGLARSIQVLVDPDRLLRLRHPKPSWLFSGFGVLSGRGAGSGRVGLLM